MLPSIMVLTSSQIKETSQPQNTGNLQTDAKKSGDFSKNLQIDLLKTCVDLNNTEINVIFTASVLTT